MEKAHEVLKARQEFKRYPVTSIAREVFDWILDELDAKTRVLDFEPMQVYVHNNRLVTTSGHRYNKDLSIFLQYYNFDELFAKLKDLIDQEKGYEAMLDKNDAVTFICIDII